MEENERERKKYNHADYNNVRVRGEGRKSKNAMEIIIKITF